MAWLAASVLGFSLNISHAHTPYRRWKVYRQRHLLIGASREDEPTYPLAKSIIEVLAQHLPEASARVARARTRYRLGSLFSTEQLKFILIAHSNLQDIANGDGDFSEFGPIDLGVIFQFGEHILIARADVPDHHAWLLTQTLMDFGMSIPGATIPTDESVPLHPGTQGAIQGEPQPKPPTTD